MRSYFSYWLMIPVVAGILSCQTRTITAPGDASKFTVKIEAATDKVNAPALQSFVVARYHDSTDGHDYWLLFGGRTNPAGTTADSSSVGGLHQAVDYNGSKSDTANHSTNNDYAYHSFPMESFNQNIYVYDVDADALTKINAGAFLQPISKFAPNVTFPFSSVNTLARQYDSTLYVAGGYGPVTLNKPGAGDTITYYTNNGLVQINVPFAIRCIKRGQCAWGTNFPVRYGADEMIRSTGGELYKINNTLYIAGGQHYKETDSIVNSDSDVVLYDQKLIYLTSVVPFTVQNGSLPYSLNINVNKAGIITDVPLDSLNTNYADTVSKFRRRDVVVAPTFINDTGTNGFVFHGGVFKPGVSALNPGQGPFSAWDDALFIHPSLSSKYSFSTDSTVYQSHNVYSCPNFVGYDNSTNNVHTFLMGGIGDGQANYWVSGFTHSVTQTIQPLGSPGTITAFPDPNGFLIGGSPKFYGAEAAFIYKTDPRLVFMQNNADILNFNATLPNAGDSIVVGYIYGGIEADVPNPGGYKGGMTRATNKIFKVTLYRNQ